MRGAGAWTAQYSQTIEAVVDLIDQDGDTSTLEKTLNVSGRLVAGADGTATELLVTSIEAPSDDPMRRAWTRRSVEYEDGRPGPDSPVNDYLQNLGLGANDYLKNLNLGVGANDYLKLQSLKSDPDLGASEQELDDGQVSDASSEDEAVEGDPDDQGDASSDSANGDD